VRPTVDVDCIVDVTTLGAYCAFVERLRESMVRGGDRGRTSARREATTTPTPNSFDTKTKCA